MLPDGSFRGIVEYCDISAAKIALTQEQGAEQESVCNEVLLSLRSLLT